MKLLALGASKAQIRGIETAIRLGHQVYTLDYLPQAPGHELAIASSFASTFDVAAATLFARDHEVQGVFTLGTDQPVYTLARVTEALGLPQLISTSTAYAVTHKVAMKAQFEKHSIPHVPYIVLHKSMLELKIDGIESQLIQMLQEVNLLAPYVIKPADSQGQRGVHYAKGVSELLDTLQDAFYHSKSGHVLVESYYENDEITVSGWVHRGQVSILAITDRITFNNPSYLGICTAHHYPSKHLTTWGPEIIDLSTRICKAFEINEGPIYFQLFKGKEGIRVNEIACRIGGAYEAHYIKRLLGIDLCEMLINSSLGLAYCFDSLRKIDILQPRGALRVQFLFANPGYVQKMVLPSEYDKLGLWEQDLFIKEGQTTGGIQNATSRVGYAILYADSIDLLHARVNQYWSELIVSNEKGESLINIEA